MVYKVIGLMSGSSLDGLDIAYVHLSQAGRGWEFQLIHTECYGYPPEWAERLAGATGLSALDYQLLHTEYGHFVGREVRRFMAAYGLEYQVQLIASHGHTTFHDPARRMTAQLGDGAAIAAGTGINVVSDLRAMDVALGGQGAPIVPIGEKLLFLGLAAFLNLGGIANVSVGARTVTGPGVTGAAMAGRAAPAMTGSVVSGPGVAGPGVAGPGVSGPAAFDVAPANRVLNALARKAGLDFDRDGLLAAAGKVDEGLLGRLNALPYYGMGWPKSLANEFGLKEVLPLVEGAGLSAEDGLRTYVEHLVVQIGRAVERLRVGAEAPAKMLVTGGGAHNGYLIGRLRAKLAELGVEVVVPDAAIVDYKEALVMALIGVLRWREENNVLASVTGASRDSVGGAVWMGGQ
ncbi:MAG TPA: anhydro-N-acetylmuramic acid kinase [Puia sp.]|nr:anhydro-N-acetylmuramic acid kinase [Puia sp.]